MAKGVRPGQRRINGELAADEVARDESDEMTEPMNPELPDERERTFRTPGFARMRVDWRSDDRVIIDQARKAVEGRVIRNFSDAYQIMHDIYEVVRTPVVDTETGEVKVDVYGFKEWEKSPSGMYIEDWSRLGMKQRERFLFAITTRLFEWQQRAADAWGEAMFAKAQFEERFAIAFDAPMSGTVDDRRAAGNIDAREERYFAIFMTLYSRKADGIVRSMELISQRIKDSMQ